MTFLYLNSDQMGQGNPELGKKLLSTFLEKLAFSDIEIDVVGCVNGAIHLTTTENDALDSLKKLQAQGAQIASCASCLNFYKKRDHVLVGKVGTMDDTVRLMVTADRVIKPC